MINNFRNFTLINEARRNKLDQVASKLVQQVFRTWVDEWQSGETQYTNFSEEISKHNLIFFLDATLHFRNDIDGFQILDTTSISDLEDHNNMQEEEDYEEEEEEDYEEEDEDYEEEEDEDYEEEEEEDYEEEEEDYEEEEEEDEDDEYQDNPTDIPHLVIDFAINPKELPAFWHDMYMILCDTMRHEIEHLTQGYAHLGMQMPGKEFKDDKEFRDLINSGELPAYFYYTLPTEVDANLHGLKFESRKRKESMLHTVMRNLSKLGFSEEETQKVLQVWRQRAEKIPGMPKF